MERTTDPPVLKYNSSPEALTIAALALLLLAWFGGQEFGTAIADILLGAEEPGGRLPTTWPAALADVPVLNTTPVDGKMVYSEGIHIGYRAWLKQEAAGGAAPALRFGFGLGYTTFDFGTAHAPQYVTAGQDVVVHIPIRNTGTRTGREVVQVYLEPWSARSAGSPATPELTLHRPERTALRCAFRRRPSAITTAGGSSSRARSACWWASTRLTTSTWWKSNYASSPFGGYGRVGSESFGPSPDFL